MTTVPCDEAPLLKTADGGFPPTRTKSSISRLSTAVLSFVVMLSGVVALNTSVAGGKITKRVFHLSGIENFGFTGNWNPEVTFTLDASWISRVVRDENPGFFAHAYTEAYVVRHNYGNPNFFETWDAVPMTRVGLRKWQLTTTEVNYEYGFALKNENGDWLREIGLWFATGGQPASPSTHMEECTVTFGFYKNRLVPQRNGGDNGPLDLANCFAACDTECVLPDAPRPMASLSAAQYKGGLTWGNDKIMCTLGSETRFDTNETAFFINGGPLSLIECPYDIGPTRFPKLTIEVVFKLASEFDPVASRGWIFGHDNGHFDRSFIISDARFGGGIGSGIGTAYDSGAPTPTKGVWHHGLAVFQQGVTDGSYTALDGIISPNKATANNNEGLETFSVGGLAGTWSTPHSMIGWITYFNFYDGTLSEDQVEAMYVKNTPWP